MRISMPEATRLGERAALDQQDDDGGATPRPRREGIAVESKRCHCVGGATKVSEAAAAASWPVIPFAAALSSRPTAPGRGCQELAALSFDG
jgi:hypothetical protein